MLGIELRTSRVDTLPGRLSITPCPIVLKPDCLFLTYILRDKHCNPCIEEEGGGRGGGGRGDEKEEEEKGFFIKIRYEWARLRLLHRQQDFAAET